MVRFNDRTERRDIFDERHNNRDEQRRDEPMDRWRRDEDIGFRQGFNADKDFRNRKRAWNEGPNDGEMADEQNHFQQTNRMWISPNGNTDRDRDRIY